MSIPTPCAASPTHVERGILPPVACGPSGYRRFTQRHLDCLRLAYQVYIGQYPGKAIHQSGVGIVQAAVGGDLAGALERAYRRRSCKRSAPRPMSPPICSNAGPYSCRP